MASEVPGLESRGTAEEELVAQTKAPSAPDT